MEHVDVAGLRIAFQQRGQGPCVLLLHGAVSDGRVWRSQLDSLSDAFTVVAWDAPGCDGSSDPPEHFRMAEYAECHGTGPTNSRQSCPRSGQRELGLWRTRSPRQISAMGFPESTFRPSCSTVTRTSAHR